MSAAPLWKETEQNDSLIFSRQLSQREAVGGGTKVIMSVVSLAEFMSPCMSSFHVTNRWKRKKTVS
jgi:hypothetical protein